VRFGSFTYVGDPVNTVRIFNELEVDELLFLDIAASRQNQGPNLKVLADIASECFMPLVYGGGIRSLNQAKSIFDIGFEKVAVNSIVAENPKIITDLANHYGSQAVVVSIDVKRGFLSEPKVYVRGGNCKTRLNFIEWAKEAEQRGAGEILLTSIDREGSWKGFDLDVVKLVTDQVNIPVIAHGGAGSLEHIRDVVRIANASAVALGSMIVFQKQGMGVLVNFPDKMQLETMLQ
jgi:cyclase